jgi:hypothetical protein
MKEVRNLREEVILEYAIFRIIISGDFSCSNDVGWENITSKVF